MAAEGSCFFTTCHKESVGRPLPTLLPAPRALDVNSHAIDICVMASTLFHTSWVLDAVAVYVGPLTKAKGHCQQQAHSVESSLAANTPPSGAKLLPIFCDLLLTPWFPFLSG